MDNFRYCTPTRYIFGRDAELEVGAQLRANGMDSVLMVYGGGSAERSGLLGRIRERLRDPQTLFHAP